MTNQQKRISRSPWMTLCVSSSNVFILSVLLLLSGCSTGSRTSMASQWPLQAGSDDIYQYYEGETLPLEAVAVLDICNPLAIMKQISPLPLTAKEEYYYSGKFAFKPGKQTVTLSYLRSSGITYYYSKPLEVTFYAEKGRVYRTFYVEEYELYMETKDEKDLNRFTVEIYDITDQEALLKMANSARLKAFRRDAEVLLRELDAKGETNTSAE